MQSVLLVFVGALATLTLAVPGLRRGALQRRPEDWIIEGASLLMHFWILPAVQVLFVYQLYRLLIPSWEGGLALPAWTGVLFYPVIDYAWYWNHRLFHSQTRWWNLHAVHHSAKHLDVFATARNSLGSHFLMVYFWFLSLGAFLLRDVTIFLGVATLGAMVNFWGHTSFGPTPGTRVYKILSYFLITPHDHYWHHSTERANCNFGTVFNVWDRIHGTWFSPNHEPKSLGNDLSLSLGRQLFFPF